MCSLSTVCLHQKVINLESVLRSARHRPSNATGAGKWQAGLSALAFFAKSHQLQVGALLQWQSSFAGDEDRADISIITSQVFFIWQIGSGYYLRITGVWLFNLEDTGNYNVPIGRRNTPCAKLKMLSCFCVDEYRLCINRLQYLQRAKISDFPSG